MKKIDIETLDCVVVAGPNTQLGTWDKIKNLVPHAVLVDITGTGSDALAAAAEASSTERFVLVNGDCVPDPEMFLQTLTLPDPDVALHWKSRNHVNGIIATAGISSYTRNGAKSGTADAEQRWIMHDCLGTQYHNSTPFLAWRAGFVAGVELCLMQGRRPTVDEFKTQVLRNLDHLTIWHNIGSDVDNGEWAMAGARQGTYMTMLTNWDHQQVHDHGALCDLWRTVEHSEPRLLSNKLGPDLGTQLDLPMAILENEQSAFFKFHYRSDWRNRGVMAKQDSDTV